MAVHEGFPFHAHPNPFRRPAHLRPAPRRPSPGPSPSSSRTFLRARASRSPPAALRPPPAAPPPAAACARRCGVSSGPRRPGAAPAPSPRRAPRSGPRELSSCAGRAARSSA
eukprot:tig00001427_g8715.t1